MIKASKVRQTRNELKSKQLKEHNELVNKEMLEVEKAINKYMNDILDTNDYVDIPIIIKTDEVKQALKDAEWYIDKSQSVEYGHTYIKEITQDDIKYDKKSDLKNDIEEQVKDDKKVKTLKFNTWGEWLDYLDKEFYKTFD